MAKQPELDLEGGRAARDEALQRVMFNAGEPWMRAALDGLRRMPYGVDLTAEDMKLRLVAMGCPWPHHPGAWGALTRNAIRRRVVFFTGRYAPMKVKRSHARRTPVYQRGGG